MYSGGAAHAVARQPLSGGRCRASERSARHSVGEQHWCGRRDAVRNRSAQIPTSFPQPRPRPPQRRGAGRTRTTIVPPRPDPLAFALRPPPSAASFERNHLPQRRGRSRWWRGGSGSHDRSGRWLAGTASSPAGVVGAGAVSETRYAYARAVPCPARHRTQIRRHSWTRAPKGPCLRVCPFAQRLTQRWPRADGDLYSLNCIFNPDPTRPPCPLHPDRTEPRPNK